VIGSPAGIVAGLLLCTASCGPGEEVRAAGVPGEANSGFVPVIVGVEFTQSAVRPGDAFAVTLRFQNEGAAPATKAHTAFVHFEPEPADCSNIAFQADHAPTVPTDTWAPGATITDAPIVVRVPVDAREGTYWVHAGLYDREGDLGRLLDVFPSTLEVSESAPPSTAWRPAPLPEEELLLRRAAFERRLAAPVTLKTDAYSFALDAESAAE